MQTQKIKWLNVRGAGHHFLFPVIAVLIVAGIGGFVMQRSSSAATVKKQCTGVIFGRYKNNPANGGTFVKYKPCVKAIQAKVGSKQDGIYGDYTQKRVKIWQSNHGKYADGVVGPKTWAAMGIRPTYTQTTKTATQSKSQSKPKLSCLPGYVNKADGSCVKLGGACTKTPLKNKGTWQPNGTCLVK